MRIVTLALTDFRNYSQFRTELPATGTIVAGPNGIGKTNLLEAIAYLAQGKSVRGTSDNALIRFSQNAFRIEGECRIADRPVKIAAAFDRARNKSVRIDGAPVKQLSQLYRYLRVVYFSPADIALVSEGPAERRHFLDVAAAQCRDDYLPVYRDFAIVLKQRNALLANLVEPAEKKAWDDRYLVHCGEVLRLRRRYLEDFTPIFRETYLAMSGGKEEPGIVYRVSGEGLVSPEDQLPGIARKYAAEELKRQRTLFGPHLDDLYLTLDGRPARVYASQGQRRCLALALRLAQSEMVRRTENDPPVLIFDDVLAELDHQRIVRLREHLPAGQQVLIATPNPEVYTVFGLVVRELGA